MPQDTIRLESMTPAHLAEAAGLSAEARWPHRPEDWALLLQISEGWVALEGADRVVGTAMLTPFGDSGGAINMVIVSEALRGRGIGRRLFATALEAAGRRRLRLTATPDGEPLYRSLGFKPFSRIVQRQGMLGTVPAASGVEDAEEPDLDAIVALDRVAFGEDRTSLLRSLWQAGRFVVIRRDGRTAAFACLREFGRGRLIGPVVAGSAEEARALIAHLAQGWQGTFMRIDLADGLGLDTWLDGLGLPQTDDGLVMWTAAPGPPSPEAAFTVALASQALG